MTKLDRIFALILFSLTVVLQFLCLFHRNEWDDWIAYALPAANLVNSGALSIPTYGAQYGFDKQWLFNSPLMGLGPLPLYFVFGVDRITYLLSIFPFVVANLFVFPLALRRALQLNSWALSVLAAQAFLGQRIYLAHIYNQRFDVAVYLLLILSFVPFEQLQNRREKMIQAFAGAGLLLVYPALGLAVLFYASGLGQMYFSGQEREVVKRRLMIFLVSGILASAWYFRFPALTVQLLPYLRYVGEIATLGMKRLHMVYGIPASAVPLTLSIGLTLFIGLLGAKVVVESFQRKRIKFIGVFGSAFLILIHVIWDFIYPCRFFYMYVGGLGPILFFGLVKGRALDISKVVLISVGVLNLAISARMDFRAPSWVGQSEAMDFVLRHTNPGDQIALGPPFVLLAAERSLPEGRRIVKSLPQVFALKEFDAKLFKEEILSQTNVYIGQAQWFEQVNIMKTMNPAPDGPIYPKSDIQSLNFSNEAVIVARKL